MKIAEKAKDLARRMKLETLALYYAYRNPKTPWYAKAWAALVVAYALSPIDLIPDFIPVLGYLDDLVLIPLGVALAVRLIPRGIYTECRELAEKKSAEPLGKSWAMGIAIIVAWVVIVAVVVWLVVKSVWPSGAAAGHGQ